jgi:hypothetical protein
VARQRKRNTTSSEEYRIIWELKDQDKQTHEILRELGRVYGETRWAYNDSNKSKIRLIVREHKGRGAQEFAIKKRSELEPEFEAMVGPYMDYTVGLVDLETAVDGFELFFNRFSGRKLPWHTKEWVRDAFQHRRLLLNVPPRHAKSTVMSVWLPIFLVCANRNVQILIISQTDDFAQKFCLEIVEHFENDTELITAFGYFVPTDSSWPWAPRDGELMVAGRERLRLPGDRTIQIRGARQQILGMEADWIICDDADSPDVVRSETTRGRFREWFDMQVITRLNPRGTAICIGQRLHPLDLYGYLAKKTRQRIEGKPKLWDHIVYPAVLEWPTEGNPGRVLWEDQWPFDELMYAYDELGEYGFETMYQQNPNPLGQRLVKQEWIEGDDQHPGCLDRDRPAGVGYRQSEDGYIPVVRVLSVDPSPTEHWGFCLADVPYNPSHSRFEASILHTEGKQLQIADAKHHIETLLQVYAPVDYLVWEWSAVSNWLAQDPWYIELSKNVRVMPHKTHGKSKGDPQYGLQSLAIEFEFGRIRLPYGDAEGRRLTESLLEECYIWPEGEYDDQLMALWFIKYVSRALFPGHTMTDELDWKDTSFDTTEFGDAAWEWEW